MAKAKPVTEKPEDPAATPTVTEGSPEVTETAPAVLGTPPAVTEEVSDSDPLAKWKTERDGLTIYNFAS